MFRIEPDTRYNVDMHSEIRYTHLEKFSHRLQILFYQR